MIDGQASGEFSANLDLTKIYVLGPRGDCFN